MIAVALVETGFTSLFYLFASMLAGLKDLAELPDDVRTQVTWHPVKTMDEVLTLALRTPLPTPVREQTPVLDGMARPT